MPQSIVLHSGVADYAPTKEEEIKIGRAMQRALEKGEEALHNKQSLTAAVDAVEAAITVMENSGIFNSGKGSVKSEDGTVEQDACIIDGSSGEYGAIGFAQGIKNPIQVARQVMKEKGQLLIVGKGVNKYAERQALEQRNNPVTFNLGTVGCVALDDSGNMCAGISSGGAFQKRSGRIGGASIVGAEVWCDNETCAVSSSGIGEEFIAHATAAGVHYAMKFGGMSLQSAVKTMVDIMPVSSAGLIAIDRQGHVVIAHNCTRFYYIHNKVNTRKKTRG